MTIFNHEYGVEPNVDYLEVQAPEGRNVLRFLQQSPGDVGDVLTQCSLDREAVERLYNALGEWLYPSGTQALPDMPGLAAVSEALAKGLANMATAVQSLHLSSVAVVKVPEAARIPSGELEPLCSRTCPSDAHPAARCTWCGHLWVQHSPAEPEPESLAAADREHERLVDGVGHGRLMSVLPRRVRRCIECGHQADAHHAPMRGWDGGCVACSCEWTGPVQ